MDGDMDFVEAPEKRVKLLRGLTFKQVIDRYKRIHLAKGVKTLLKTMNAIGSNSVTVSGGFFFTEKIANDLGLSQSYTNKLVFNGDSLSDAIVSPVLGKVKNR